MAHFAKRWPGGLVNGVSTVDHTDLEFIDADQAAAVNGDAGGAWAPTSPISIGGFGLQRSYKAATWDDFAADGGAARTVVRRGSFVPVMRMLVGAINDWGVAQGMGFGPILTAALLIPPDHATLTKIRTYFKVSVGRVTMPITGPGLDVTAYDPSLSPPVAVQLSSTNTQYFALPPPPTTNYELATTQFWDYVPNQNNVLDRTTNLYVLTLSDEANGGAIGLNKFYGYEATFTMADWRP